MRNVISFDKTFRSFVMNQKAKKVLKIVLLSVGGVLVTVVSLFGGFLIYASATTLPVKDVEKMNVKGEVSEKVDKSASMTLLTWNIGYGALDERADFYMDGGKGVIGESKENTINNVNVMSKKIQELNPDVFFIQEADLDSKRSHYVNDEKILKEYFDESHYEQSFAKNFQAGYIPIPLGNALGKVKSGITTFAKYDTELSNRIQLPIPFSWPIKLFNLKRCLLVSYLPIKDSEQKLVLINLHLEAYDDGEGKAKQLKQLMDLMKEENDKGNYVIAGGDFNQTFSTTNYQKYPKMNDWVCPVIEANEYPSFNFLMDDTYPTCRSLYKPYFNSDKANHQYYMIDGFIVSNNVKVNTLETLNLGFANSDHNPVMMNVSFL